MVPVPYGAYPTACYGYYDYDPAFLWAYAKYAKDDLLYGEYLQKMIHGVKDHEEFIALNGGRRRLARIKADPGNGICGQPGQGMRRRRWGNTPCGR